jgi:hypothetical protein
VLSSDFGLNVVFEKTLQDEKLLLLKKVRVALNSFMQNTCPFHHFTSVLGL